MTRTRVLVVEDDAVAKSVVRAAIEQASDMELAGEATTAAEALSVAQRESPDVIVLDHHLPGEAYGRSPMQGIEAVEFLRALPSAPRIVVHSATGGLGTSADNAGADAFVEKSSDCAELLAVIRRLADS